LGGGVFSAVLSDLVGDHGEHGRSPGAGGLDGGVRLEQVGLVGDVRDDVHDRADGLAWVKSARLFACSSAVWRPGPRDWHHGIEYDPPLGRVGIVARGVRVVGGLARR
jgi:hypothetical protein